MIYYLDLHGSDKFNWSSVKLEYHEKYNALRSNQLAPASHKYERKKSI